MMILVVDSVVDRGKETQNLPFKIIRSLKDLNQRIKIAEQFFCIYVYELFSILHFFLLGKIILWEIFDIKEEIYNQVLLRLQSNKKMKCKESDIARDS